MIADLVRAFVEAVVVREVMAGRPILPNWKIESVEVHDGFIDVTWSEP